MKTLDRKGLKIVAHLMAVSARTAPKAGGDDWIETKIATTKEKNELSRIMPELGEMKGKAVSTTDRRRGEAIRMDWLSDAKSIGNSGLLFLLGVQGRKAVGINCGGCGFQTCAKMLKQKPLSIEGGNFPGPFCMFRIMDLSIAAASAVKTAMNHNVDNRLMQKAGIAAFRLRLLKSCDLIIGIPLSATGKNIFFDRAEKLEAWKIFKPQRD